MASEATLACTRESGKGHSVVLRGQQLHPLQHILQMFIDASDEGWGAHLRGSTAGGVWSDTESYLHINFLDFKGLPGPQEFRASLQGLDCIVSNRQHNCNLLHQQGGRYEIRLYLCPWEISVLV